MTALNPTTILPNYPSGSDITSEASLMKSDSKHLPWKISIYREETITEKNTCTPMFFAALITIASTWEQPRCPSTDEWIKICYIHTRKYYSMIKKNEFESVRVRQMNLGPVIQSEVGQKEKNKYSISTHIFGI